ncbi:MAG: SPFH domain-containing protein [Candidatus Promineifilaceae bacterium]
MIKSQSKPNLASRLRQLFGFVIIPQGKVQIVTMEEQFHSFLEAGSHFWFFKRFYLEKAHILAVTMRPIKIANIPCRSVDTVPMSVDVELLYRFNPVDVKDAALQAELALIDSMVIADSIAKRSLASAIRQVIGKYGEADLRNGRTWPTLENEARAIFKRKANFLGFTCIELNIEMIRAEAALESKTTDAAAWRNFARQMEDVSSETAERIFEVIGLESYGRGGGRARLDRKQTEKVGPKRDNRYRHGNRPNSQDTYQQTTYD